MKWEYKVEALEAAFSNALESQLNILGSDGWELVSLTSNNWAEARCIFKRPVPASVSLSGCVVECDTEATAAQLFGLLEKAAKSQRKPIGARE